MQYAHGSNCKFIFMHGVWMSAENKVGYITIYIYMNALEFIGIEYQEATAITYNL